MAWGAGLLCGPAVAGFVYERAGFAWLTLLWAPMLLIVSLLLARVQSGFRPEPVEGPDTIKPTAPVAPPGNGGVRL
jgi:MFS family permease